jgi:shikimate dehydrogenase
MLLYQGVEAFELWTGRAAPVAAMDDALRTHLRDDRYRV